VEVLSGDKSKRVSVRTSNLLLSNSKTSTSVLPEQSQSSLQKKWSIHDLVLFKSREDANRQDPGVVVKVEKNSIRVLLNDNMTENITFNQVVQIVARNKKFSATDKNTNSLSLGDNVKVLEGFFRGSQGSIRHIFKNIVWLVCPEQEDNLG